MSTFELKTHQIGKTYSNPHFFILNKGLNSGKPLSNPCPNCFVIITKNESDKNTLFHLSMMLQIGGFYAFYLKGSVIPFICIADVKNLILKNSKYFGQKDFENKLSALNELVKLEIVLQKKLKAILELKTILLKSYKLDY